MIFINYPGHLIAFVLIAIFAGGIFLAFHSPDLRKAKNNPLRYFLMTVRLVVIILLLLILWDPSGYDKKKPFADNNILVMFDTSRSMSTLDDSQSTRLDKAIEVFKRVFNRESPESLKHNIFGFDNRAYYSGSTELLRRWGSKTDMQNAFAILGKYNHYNIFDDSKRADNYHDPTSSNNGRIAGAVLYTDGQTLNKSIDSYASLINNKLPILIVGVGPRERQIDTAIESIDSPTRVAIDSVFTIEVVANIDKSIKQPVLVELLRDDSVIDSNEIVLTWEKYPEKNSRKL